MIKIIPTHFNVYSDDKETMDGMRNGEYLGFIAHEDKIFVFFPETDFITTNELIAIGEKLKELNNNK